MNPNEYDANYSGSYRTRTPNYARNHDYDRGSLSTKNDYDVDSMLSSRSRDNPRWDRRSDNYDRRNEVSAPQYSRADSPPRQYVPYRGSEYDKPEPPIRREHSPIMKQARTAVFKGFTTPLPGNDLGYDDIENKRMRYMPPPPLEPERSYKGFTSSSLHESPYKDPRFRYNGGRDNTDDYPPEAVSNMRAPPARRYVPDNASVSTRYDGCDRSWDGGGPFYDPSYHGEQSLSPKTFKKECQRAYKEARAQRMRNLEEGLYGKCDWATFDISLKHLGDVSNCKRCFEEALKRNKDDVEACVNYALFLFSLNEKTYAAKYHSHFLHLLNILPNIDKELIHMGNSLTDALKTDQIEDTDDSVFTDKTPHDETTLSVSNTAQNDFDYDLV